MSEKSEEKIGWGKNETDGWEDNNLRGVLISPTGKHRTKSLSLSLSVQQTRTRKSLSSDSLFLLLYLFVCASLSLSLSCALSSVFFATVSLCLFPLTLFPSTTHAHITLQSCCFQRMSSCLSTSEHSLRYLPGWMLCMKMMLMMMIVVMFLNLWWSQWCCIFFFAILRLDWIRKDKKNISWVCAWFITSSPNFVLVHPTDP